MRSWMRHKMSTLRLVRHGLQLGISANPPVYWMALTDAFMFLYRAWLRCFLTPSGPDWRCERANSQLVGQSQLMIDVRAFHCLLHKVDRLPIHSWKSSVFSPSRDITLEHCPRRLISAQQEIGCGDRSSELWRFLLRWTIDMIWSHKH